jgi:hypothetical protein
MGMDSQERLRRCYFHEELDRPGVYVRTGFPSDDPTYDRLKAYLAAHTELKRGWSAAALVEREPADHFFEDVSEDWRRRVNVLHTPAGDLRSTDLVSLRGQPGLAETYFLKTREDAEKYLSLAMPEISGEVDGFFEAVEAMGDRGIVSVHVGRNPASVAAQLFGSETFAVMTVTDRDVVHAICERQMNVLLATVKHVAGLGVGPYFAMAGEEFVVPPLHGPKDFYDFNVKYDKPVIDLVHEAGGRMHVHCHGSIKRVFEGFLDAGVDVLHPFEAPPMGDVTPAEAKDLARGLMCLEGNIQIADMYDRSPAEIADQSRALIDECFDDRCGLIVCPTASPYIRGAGERAYPQFVAMIDAVLAFGG